MDRLFSLLRERVHDFGGRVVKYTGDGIMAVFGIPEVREDDAIRAVRSAASMQEAFTAHAQEVARDWGTDIALRVGVNTGEVVVTEGDDDVVGDAVNVANRLEHAAPEGGVLVGEPTWRLARDAMAFARVAALELRGRAEPVPAFRLVSLEPTTGATLPSPFVGRATELELINEAFERVLAERRPRLVSVIGSAGLGKSRLAANFVDSIRDRARVMFARCDPAGPSTFTPIAEALRAATGIEESATDSEIFDRLLNLSPPDDEDRLRIATVAASLLGTADAGTAEEMFWAVRRLLDWIALGAPIVLVIDDAQWAESMLLDMIDHLVDWSKDTPLLVLILARTEIRETRPALSEASATTDVIVLEGLDPHSTTVLAGDLLGFRHVPEELVERFLDATDGNPLFLRELLRMLVEDGTLKLEGDRWTLSKDVSELDIPPTIQALLSARLERLHSDERSVVERASVVGKEFYRGALLELVPSTVRSGLDGHLETLHRKDLVEPEGTFWIDEPVFRFHHVLIRDAAYRRLLKEARAELHERFADWLEQKVGELIGEHEELVGYHLEQAHEYRRQLGPLDPHGIALGQRAADRLAAASRRSLERDDLSAAASLAGRALERLAPEDQSRANILLDRCEALLAIGDVAAGWEALNQLTAYNDPRLRAWANCFAAELTILTNPERLRENADLAATAAAELDELSDMAGAAKAHAVHAQALVKLGNFGGSEQALDRALVAARNAADARRSNAVLASVPVAALWGPSPVSRASGRCLDVVRVVRITQGAPSVEATAVRCHAVLEALRGEADSGRRMLAVAREKMEARGLAHAVHQANFFAGIVESLDGNDAIAATHFRGAYTGFSSLGHAGDAAQAGAFLARALLAQGSSDEIDTLTRESENHGGDDLKTSIAWRSVRAEALARSGSLDEALRLARDAVTIAQSTDALLDHGDARTSLASVLRAGGNHAEADEEDAKARELFVRKGAVIKLGRSFATPVVTGTEQFVEEAEITSPSPARLAHDRYVAAYNANDWAAVRAVIHDDFIVVDHRPLSLFTHRGADRWIEMLSTMFQSSPETGHVRRWIAHSPNIGMADLVQTGHVGTSVDDVLQGLLVVACAVGDKLARAEIFDPSDEAIGRARMEELSSQF